MQWQNKIIPKVTSLSSKAILEIIFMSLVSFWSRYGRHKAIEIIDSGEVEVTQNAVVVATIGEWGTFGELALMHGQPRSATVTATSDRLKLWAIDRHTYRQQR